MSHILWKKHFLLLLVFIGIYEIVKYYREQKDKREVVDEEEEEILSHHPITDENVEIATKESAGFIEEDEIERDVDENNQDPSF